MRGLLIGRDGRPQFWFEVPDPAPEIWRMDVGDSRPAERPHEGTILLVRRVDVGVDYRGSYAVYRNARLGIGAARAELHSDEPRVADREVTTD